MASKKNTARSKNMRRSSTTSNKRSVSKVLSDMFMGACPRLWRRFFGLPEPTGDSYEDYCENNQMLTTPTAKLGRQGERLVFDHIRQNPKNRVIACNSANYYCEIDIVFLDESSKEIVFVEVKTRRRDDARYPPIINSVDAKRRKKLALAAERFMLDRGYLEYAVRFDIAIVLLPKVGKSKLSYYQDAFSFARALQEYAYDDFGKTRSDKTLRSDVRDYYQRERCNSEVKKTRL